MCEHPSHTDTLSKLQLTSFRFLWTLQAKRLISEEEFTDLRLCMTQVGSEYKDGDLIPRQVLKDMYMTIVVIRNEAHAFARVETERLNGMAAALEEIFHLMLIGETPEMRIPGVPRII